MTMGGWRVEGFEFGTENRRMAIELQKERSRASHGVRFANGYLQVFEWSIWTIALCCSYYVNSYQLNDVQILAPACLFDKASLINNKENYGRHYHQLIAPILF